jgi:hypothetical protein
VADIYAAMISCNSIRHFPGIRYGRRVVRAGDTHPARPELAPFKGFISGDILIELTEIFERDRSLIVSSR